MTCPPLLDRVVEAIAAGITVSGEGIHWGAESQKGGGIPVGNSHFLNTTRSSVAYGVWGSNASAAGGGALASAGVLARRSSDIDPSAPLSGGKNRGAAWGGGAGGKGVGDEDDGAGEADGGSVSIGEAKVGCFCWGGAARAGTGSVADA